MANEKSDKNKVSTGTTQEQPQSVKHAGQQQKQATAHDEKSCTNPNHHHGKDADITKPNPNSKPAR